MKFLPDNILLGLYFETMFSYRALLCDDKMFIKCLSCVLSKQSRNNTLLYYAKHVTSMTWLDFT